MCREKWLHLRHKEEGVHWTSLTGSGMEKGEGEKQRRQKKRVEQFYSRGAIAKREEWLNMRNAKEGFWRNLAGIVGGRRGKERGRRTHKIQK